MHSLFLMQQTILQQIPITPKKLFQAVRGNNGNADEGDGSAAGGKSCKGILFYRENFQICSNKNYIIKCRIKVKLDIKTIMLYTKIVLESN